LDPAVASPSSICVAVPGVMSAQVASSLANTSPPLARPNSRPNCVVELARMMRVAPAQPAHGGIRAFEGRPKALERFAVLYVDAAARGGGRRARWRDHATFSAKGFGSLGSPVGAVVTLACRAWRSARSRITQGTIDTATIAAAHQSDVS
jgi:hypothetical protein